MRSETYSRFKAITSCIKKWSIQFIRVVWRSGWSVITLLLLFFALLLMDQGADMLIGVVTDTGGITGGHLSVIQCYIFTTLLALFIWYMPKLLIPDSRYTPISKIITHGDSTASNIGFLKRSKFLISQSLNASKYISKPSKGDENKGSFWFLEDHQFPRLLGVSVFLIVGISCLNIHYQFLELKDSIFKFLLNHKVGVLFSLLIVFGIILSWLDKKYKTHKDLEIKAKYLSLIGVLLIIFLIITVFGSFLGEQDRLMFLGYGILLTAIPFSIFVVTRQKINFSPFLKKVKLFKPVVGLGLFLFSLLIFFNIGFYSPGLIFEYPFGVLMVLLSVIVFVTTLFNYIVIKLDIAFPAYILIVLISILPFNDTHHDVRLFTSTSKVKKVSLESYFEEWLDDRGLILHPDSLSSADTSKYPVFFIAAEGGGSTMALWSSLVLSELDEDPNFYNHTFMLTGASGGIAGASHFLAVKNYLSDTGKEIKSNKLTDIFSNTFTNDFLSGSLCYLFGRDIFSSFIPLNGLEDRAAFLEREWSLELYNNIHQKKIQNLQGNGDKESPLNIDYFNLYYKGDSVYTGHPLAIYCPASVKSGNQGFIHPFTSFKDNSSFPFSIDILNHLNDSVDNSMRLSTGALLQGRFPYINSIGNIDACKESFVDGGYYDNNGGIKTLEFLRAVNDLKGAYNLKKELVFYLVSIQKRDKILKDSEVKQGAGVLQAAVNSRWGSSRQNLALAKRSKLWENYFEFDLPTENFDRSLSSDDTYFVIPLARYLSANASRLIEDQLKEESNKKSFESIKKLKLE
jgi:hypothetical protein